MLLYLRISFLLPIYGKTYQADLGSIYERVGTECQILVILGLAQEL